MTTKTDSIAPLAATDVGFATALTFDDVLLVPRYSDVAVTSRAAGSPGQQD